MLRWVMRDNGIHRLLATTVKSGNYSRVFFMMRIATNHCKNNHLLIALDTAIIGEVHKADARLIF
jgi:hypothetical protein